MRYLDGLDNKTIADQVGIKRGAVDVALHYCHVKLRELVER